MQASVIETTEELSTAVSGGGILVAAGGNFSGRTGLLRALTALAHADAPASQQLPSLPGPGAFVGAEIYNSLSALALTVAEELRLAAVEEAAFSEGLSVLRELGFGKIERRNPFRVSGGEQAVLAVVSAALGAPAVLALDCCLEQVDAEVRASLIEWLRRFRPAKTIVALADNRLAEYSNFADARCIETPQFITARERAPAIEQYQHAGLLPTESVALVLEGVEYSYPNGHQVLRGCSFALQPGTAYLLQGPNGSGKSTLAKILSGALEPTFGQIKVNGRPYRPWLHPAEIVAYHFQNPDLQLFSTTVRKEIAAGLPRHGVSAIQRVTVIDSLLSTFGLQQVAEQHPLDLPFVLRKRVALAATLAMLRPWIILDEPTLGQDDRSTLGVTTLVSALCSLGYGVIVITHCASLHSSLNPRLRLEAGRVSGVLR